MSHTTDISKKIKETKQEAEELKTQLQTLIDEGQKKICPSYSKQNFTSKELEHEKTLKSPNKVQIIKSYENKHSRIYSVDIPENKTEANIESPEKTKKYDVHETREFMKRQKEKQKIEQKQTLKEEKIRAELQKKKLEELNRKSRLLVAKNIQAQRERSISREREVYIRPDDSNNLRKAKSSDPLNNVTQNKTLNIIHPPELKNTGAKKKCVTLSKNPVVTENKKISIISRNCTGETNTRSTNFKESTAISKDSCADIQNTDKKNSENTESQLVNNLQSGLLKPVLKFQDQTSPISHLNNNSTSGKLRPISLFESKETKTSLPNSSRICKEPVTNVLDYKSGSIKSVITSKSSKDVNEDKEKHQKAISTVTNKSNEALQPVVQCSVEIQTENSNKGFPQWLQEQPPQAYPFNFINTIKRKLQTATSQKPTTDIGIQSSIPPTESSKREKKSFSSQKCPNLNTESIEQLELVPKSKYKLVQSNIPVIKVIETESESDTSKNIPEISSESGTSLKKNAESVRKNLVFNTNLINTEKIDNMKLITHDLGSTKIIKKTELKPPPSSSRSKNIDDNKYSSDFDSDFDRSSESLDRSRESILSFNKSNYDRIIVSPQSEIIISPINNRKETNPDIILKSGSKLSHIESIKSTESVTNSNVNGSSSKSRSTKSVPTQSVITSLSNKEIILQNINTKRGSGSKSRLEISLSPSPSSESVITSLLKNDNGLQNVNTSRDCSSSVKSNKILSEERSNHGPSVSDNIVTSSKNSVDHTDIRPSTSSINMTIPKSDTSLKNVNLQRGSRFSEEEKINSIKLVEPAVSLVSVNKAVESGPESEGSNKMFKNISIKSNKISTKHYSNDRNHIHLKFEAEIHLLNDFNKSIQKFSALEEAVENLKTKNSLTASKILQNNDAQTSLKSSKEKSEQIESRNSRINYSRGSFTNNSIDDLDLLSNASLDLDNNSIVSTGLELSNLNSNNKSVSVKGDDPLMNLENFQPANVAGISLNMFEQLIKDEDARLEHLKTILKIREQALLDRTKGELAWLEIQRKHLKETGKLQEASVIKKKQRGILVNHQKEKHEMQRLKQMQKAQSLERKIVLKEQRNLIRQQLSTDNMLTKMKVNTPRERRQSGPLKVLQSNTESIRSETSISCRSSSDKEKDIYTITSHQSVISERSEIEFSSKDRPSLKHQDYIKKTLLMRESALKKRREAAEGLLQWHKKLLEEEKRIAILESTASAIISQKPNTPSTFKGKELNQLWYNLTGTETKKFINDKNYPMSQMALERFCKSAREFSQKSKTLLKKSSDNDDKTSASEKISTENDYGSDFDNESIVLDQSIDILINNFNKIQDNISTLNINKSKSDTSSIDEEILDKEAEISVIETNRIDSSISNQKSESDSSKRSSSIITKPTRKTTSHISSQSSSISEIKSKSIEESQKLSDNFIITSEPLKSDPTVNSEVKKQESMGLSENLTSTIDNFVENEFEDTNEENISKDSVILTNSGSKKSSNHSIRSYEVPEVSISQKSEESVDKTSSIKFGIKNDHSFDHQEVSEEKLLTDEDLSQKSVDGSSHKSTASSIRSDIKQYDHQEVSEEKLLIDEELSQKSVNGSSHKSSASSIKSDYRKDNHQEVSEKKLLTDLHLSQKSVDRSSHKSSASSIKSDFRKDNSSDHQEVSVDGSSHKSSASSTKSDYRKDNHLSDHQEATEENLLTDEDLSQKSVDGSSHKSSASSIKYDFRKDNHQEVSEEKLLTDSQKSVHRSSHKSSTSSIKSDYKKDNHQEVSKENLLIDKDLSQKSVDRRSYKSSASSIKSDYRKDNHQEVSKENLLIDEDLSQKSVDRRSYKSSASSIKSDYRKDNQQEVSEENLLTDEDLSQKSVDRCSHKSSASSIKSDYRQDNQQEVSEEKVLTDLHLSQKSVDGSSHKSSASSIKSDYRKDNHQEVSKEKLLTDENLSQESVDGSSHKSSASSIKSDFRKDNHLSDHQEVSVDRSSYKSSVSSVKSDFRQDNHSYDHQEGSEVKLLTDEELSQKSVDGSSHKSSASSIKSDFRKDNYQEVSKEKLLTDENLSQKSVDGSSHKSSASSIKSDFRKDNHQEVSAEKLLTDEALSQKSVDGSCHKSSVSSVKSDYRKDNHSSDHQQVLEINLLTNEESEYKNSKGSDRVLSTHSNKSSIPSKQSSLKNDTSSILTEPHEYPKSQQSEDFGDKKLSTHSNKSLKPHQHTQLFKDMEISQKIEDCDDKKLSTDSHKSSIEHLEEKVSMDLELSQKSEDDAIQIELSHKSEDSIRNKSTHSQSSTSIPKSDIISLSGKPDYQKSTDILSKIHIVGLGEIKDVSGIKIHSVSHKSKVEPYEHTKENTDTIDEAISSISSDSSLSNEEIYPRITKATKETLNESQEILHILGETEIKVISDEEPIENQIKDNLTASEEILSKLIQPIENHDENQIAPNETDDLLSQSLLKLYQISKSDKEEILDIGVPLVDSTLCINDDEEKLVPELIESKVDETIDENVDELYKTTSAFKIDQNNENQTFLNNLVASSTEINVQLDTNEDSDESKLALSEKSNESFVVNEEIEEKVKSDDYTSVEEESEYSHFSYGVLERTEDKETSDSVITDIPQIKEDATYEEKEHDSLSSASEVLNLEEQEVSSKSKNSIEDNIDVKKRVSEILADKNLSRGDKSPRLQDLYVTTYDLISPANSPEKGSSSPVEEHKLVSSIFDSEAEEILRKQLAVEEEIKAITEQQQKEQQLPLLYIREIPNKPPPPYTPPSSLNIITVPTIIPSSDEIEEITMYSAKILHKAYLSNNLANVNISNNTLSLISKNISKDCYKFVFDLCKDIAREHYKQFEEDKSPSWLRVSKKPEFTLIKPLDTEGLKVHMIKKLKEIFGYQKVNKRENAIIKWSRKKRDHVDEILVLDCQQEEAQWINYEKDELLVKDQITDEIFESLLKDTANVFLKLL